MNHKSTTTHEKFFHRTYPAGSVAGINGKIRQISAVTAFARQLPDGSWAVAHAECDHRDQFCRRTGRNIARRKWFAGKRQSIPEATYENALTGYVL